MSRSNDLEKTIKDKTDKTVEVDIVDMLSDIEYQKQVAMKETPAIIEMLSDELDEVNKIISSKKFTKGDILKITQKLIESIIGLGKFLIVIDYKMDIMDGALRSIIHRMDAIDSEEEEEEKEEIINKDERDEQHKPYI